MKPYEYVMPKQRPLELITFKAHSLRYGDRILVLLYLPAGEELSDKHLDDAENLMREIYG